MTSRPRDPAGYGVVFACGFYALILQTLLFRGFLTVHEGNELGVSVFFCSWLFWGAVGALLGRFRWRGWEWCLARFPLTPLLFIPAYLLQALLILRARELAGVAAYQVFPFARMLPVAWLANAPVGLTSGVLFALASAWAARTQAIPAARVFIIEALGAFAGGVAVTAALAAGRSETWVFLAAVSAAGLAGLPACAAIGRGTVGLAPALAALLILVGGGPERIDERLDRYRWGRVLPPASLEGRFVTPQAVHLYGTYRGQFHVMAWESIADTVPGQEYASEILAIHLAQHPAARRILVFGPHGYSLCRRLLHLDQVEQVSWLDPDPDYPRQVLGVLPADLRVDDDRLHIPGTDARRFLAQTPDRFDLAILNLPDVTTLALNRFLTREFLALVGGRLAPGGLLSIRVSGGENVMGDELVNLGAATYRTLSDLFAEIAIKPGDETWLFAGPGGLPEQAPAVLRDRFASVSGAGALYPAAALPGLFPPDRIRFQREAYQRALAADAGQRLLNTDRRPRALLHSLLLAAREAGVGPRWPNRVRRFADAGAPVVPFVLVLAVALRLVFRQTARRHGPIARAGYFDWFVMVGAGGAVAMALNIILMFLYQARHGALFLNMGLVSALYMVGLALGGWGAESWAVGRARDLRRAVPAVVAGHGLVLLTLHRGSAGASEPVFLLWFLAAGAVGGMYFPLAAGVLKRDGVPDRAAGGGLAAGDDLGGAVGGTVAGLLLLPVFGAGYALAMLAGTLAAAMLPLLAGSPDSPPGVPADRFLAAVRPVGYLLFGVAAASLGSAVWLAHAAEPGRAARLEQAAREMAPGVVFEPAAAGELRHLRGRTNYCFSSQALVTDISGYGGPIELAILTDPSGTVREVRVIRSHETPAYLADVIPWLATLRGRPLIAPAAPLDGVSGATLTAAAIAATLERAGQRFAADVLHLGPGPAAQADVRAPSIRLWVLAGLAAAAVVLRWAPSRRARRVFLLVAAVVTGLWLNVQYSMAQVLALLGGVVPPPGWNLAFLTVIGIPALVVLFGNLYCGYLCPFGALQELVGDLRPARFRPDPDRHVCRGARLLKYALLFALVMMFAYRLDPDLAAVDPLVTVFSRPASGGAAVFLLAALGLSFCYRRFWCRTLCPVGAFLSLLHGGRLLRRILPPIAPAACRFGIAGKHELDCLACNRCRRLTRRERAALTPPPAASARRRNIAFIAMVLLAAALVLGRAGDAWRLAAAPSGHAAVSAAGTPRDVDLRRLRWLIDQGRLSDREARYAAPAD